MQAYMANAHVLCEYDNPTPLTNTPAEYQADLDEGSDTSKQITD
jgi:hypothetical protein